MKDALVLLLTRLAEWVGYPKTQLKELYAPLELLMNDATILFGLYPEVLLAAEAAGMMSERQQRKARQDAELVMREAEAINDKVEALIRAKWDLVDRNDVAYFYEFLENRLRQRHSSTIALELSPAVSFDGVFAHRIRAKAEAKRMWPFGRLRKSQVRPDRPLLGKVMTGRRSPPVANRTDARPSVSDASSPDPRPE